jgi:hypothetical protein
VSPIWKILPWHLTHASGELFKMMAGGNVTRVPYREDLKAPMGPSLSKPFAEAALNILGPLSSRVHVGASQPAREELVLTIISTSALSYPNKRANLEVSTVNLPLSPVPMGIITVKRS